MRSQAGTYRPSGPGASAPADRAALPSVLCFGEVLWDVFPDQQALGGAPANVAYHATRLGLKGGLLSAVGDDPLGARALEELKRRGVSIEGVTRSRQAATGIVTVTYEAGEPRYQIAENAAWDQLCIPRGFPTHGQAAIVFGSLALRQAPNRELLLQLLERAVGFQETRQHERPWIVFDVNLRPPFDTDDALFPFLEKAHLLKMNQAEFTELEVRRPHFIQRLFQHSSLRLLAVTGGARGAQLLTRNGSCKCDGFYSSGIDPVGAGDAFTAALTCGLIAKRPLPECLERACRYAARVAGTRGAMAEVSTW